MSEIVNNPPDASALMCSARSFGNYDLASAIADLADNSISAGAKSISITCKYNDGDPVVIVRDDGCGMSSVELQKAMRPASTNPLDERSPDDLGRFGWGMKSASFSQCKRLYVFSNDGTELSGASWDLDDIDQWKMRVYSRGECESEVPELASAIGTAVVWKDCDRLSENGSLSPAEFNELIAYCRRRLALTFHRYISATYGARKIEFAINKTLLPAIDPFYREHSATQPLEVEEYPVPEHNSIIKVRPYILPHFSKLKKPEYDEISGEEGLARNQGFYVYRNNRLIIYGTWFRLLRHTELSQLVRIAVDIPASLDSEWKITIDKSEAQLPIIFRRRLKNLAERFQKKSRRVFSSKGGRIDSREQTSLWNRYSRNNNVTYSLNREHPLIQTFMEKIEASEKSNFESILRFIEATVPSVRIASDVSKSGEGVECSVPSGDEYLDLVRSTLPALLAHYDGDGSKLLWHLKHTEPYSSHYTFIEKYLREELRLNV